MIRSPLTHSLKSEYAMWCWTSQYFEKGQHHNSDSITYKPQLTSSNHVFRMLSQLCDVVSFSVCFSSYQYMLQNCRWEVHTLCGCRRYCWFLLWSPDSDNRFNLKPGTTTTTIIIMAHWYYIIATTKNIYNHWNIARRMMKGW